jgi:uncharacterized membrane protein YdjX (TVP38/TMEM64 family)
MLGWIAGSAVSFALARHFSPGIVRRIPRVSRYANIDRLIHPSHPILSLVVLRMTFPVDVLSYALGLFSARTSALDNLLSTLVGVAPFAFSFVLLPALSLPAQFVFLAASSLVFLSYAVWVLRTETIRRTRPALGVLDLDTADVMFVTPEDRAPDRRQAWGPHHRCATTPASAGARPMR